MAGFGAALAKMDAAIMSSLNDGNGEYREPSVPPVSDVELIIDFNLQQAGPDGLFTTEAVGITWRKSALASVRRGGVFYFQKRRFVVEVIVSDDGYMLTAACLEQK